MLPCDGDKLSQVALAASRAALFLAAFMSLFNSIVVTYRKVKVHKLCHTCGNQMDGKQREIAWQTRWHTSTNHLNI
jgi:hypothetical protein